MKNKKENVVSTKKLAMCAILTALVVVLQFMGAFIHIGIFSVSLVLIPIVIGTATCGAGVGAWLGFVFGVVVLLSGDAGAFLAVNIPGTIVTVLLKGILCGYISGLVYKLVERINRYVGVLAAAIVCPLVNTGVFLLGCVVFFMGTITGWATELGLGQNVVHYMFIYLAGGNFLFELGLNIILSPAVVRLLNIRSKQ